MLIMKTFDEKWQECAARARTGPPAPATMPPGFAEGVMRRRSQPESIAFAAERLWLQFGLRTLAAMSALLVVFIAVRLNPVSRARLLRPPIENSIVDYSGLL